MADEIRSFKLNTGAEIPAIGLGTYAVPPEIMATAIKEPLSPPSYPSYIISIVYRLHTLSMALIGYRHIDCAHIYGNEKEIGAVLKKLLAEGAVKREDLFITSKLWNFDHESEDVPKALNRTLSDLQLDYVDLYLIHWPMKVKRGSSEENPENFLQPDIPSTWKAMEALYDSGKARAIGVSNFSSKKLGELLKVARVAPAVNQVECHPLWQQNQLHAYCKSHGIHLSGYSPLGSQRPSGLLTEPVVKMVAEKLGKSPGQVALRWGLQMGHSVLPKSSNEARIKENFEIFDWSIPQELMAKFSDLKQGKFIKGEEFVHEKSCGYKTLEELWDEEV